MSTGFFISIIRSKGVSQDSDSHNPTLNAALDNYEIYLNGSRFWKFISIRISKRFFIKIFVSEETGW